MTSEDLLYTGTITDIAGLIRDCKFPAEAFVLVERAPHSVIGEEREKRRDLLRLARLSDGIDTASYTSGRVFNSDFELRWEQDALGDGEISVVYIGPARDLPGLTTGRYTLVPVQEHEERREAKKDAPPQYYLFGKLLNKENLDNMVLTLEPGSAYYAEARVPRLLPYPEVEKRDGALPDRLQVIIQEYRVMVNDTEKQEQREDGYTYRFAGLVPAREEKNA